MKRLIFWGILGIILSVGYSLLSPLATTDVAYQQLQDSDSVVNSVRAEHFLKNNVYILGVAAYFLLGALMFFGDAKKLVKTALFISLLAVLPGCYRPFEPVKLKEISTSEEGFLIPLRGDKTKQVSTNSEDDLKKNLVQAKQVQIPQQWVPKGYEYMGANGEWQDAAVLIKVDRAPVTREWTADPTSGTSNKNEAIWVMTSDQVEFSTGWTITAYIMNRDDSVKFLHYYPEGSLPKVLDTEVRAKLQSTFGLECTDIAMESLRKEATPHIHNTTKQIITFFKERGITITNLGITGGFVYKNPTISDMLVKVFNAEQEKNIAAAATAAQEEKNKRIRMEAEGKAAALLLEKNAEAKGIQAVADAKAYEIEKAQQNKDLYLALKRVELEQAKLKVWDGRFPFYYFGGGNGNTPDLLLNVPDFKEINTGNFTIDPKAPTHRTGAIPPKELLDK